MKTVPLADVLWRAANEFLQTDKYDNNQAWGPSCCAVMQAIRPNWRSRSRSLHDQAANMPAFRFLRALGCDTHDLSMSCRPNPQSVRYMWLLLAMHVAADENIMVEVSQ